MSYFLTTKSGHEIKITDEQKAKVEEAVRMNRKHISVNDNLMSIIDISGIYDEPKPRRGQFFCSHENWHLDGDICYCAKYKAEREAFQNEIKDPSRLLAVDQTPRCRGQHSIQANITKIIMDKYGKEWKDYIRNEEVREEIRMLLHEHTQKKWCDFKAETCFCSSEPDAPQDISWRELFRKEELVRELK